jgi:mannitol/fructose-specific phosphotransferase system IIA component (Ntr-type)
MDEDSRKPKFSDFVRAELIDTGLEASCKREAIERLVGLLAGQGLVRDRKTLLTRLMEREALMSTGIGGGVAIPHAQTRELDAYYVAIGRCPLGLDFDAIDKQPVYLVFLIAGPENRPGIHLRLISTLTHLLQRPTLVDELKQLGTPAEFFEAFRRMETAR